MLNETTLKLPFGEFRGQLARTLVEKNPKYLVYLVEKTNLADAKKDMLIKLLQTADIEPPTYAPQTVSTEQQICELIAEASISARVEFVQDERRIFLKDTGRGHYVYLVPEPGFYDQFLALLREGRHPTILKFSHDSALRVVEALTRRRKLRALVA